MTNNHAYRPDIDGLRAIAVVPVVLFHAGLPIMPGGYVGVDVFFVISGYLITGIIASEIDAGRFSILTFYERRIRRIFPALFAVLAATTAGSLLVLFPRDLVDFGQSVAATTLFASNILFEIEVDYFGRAAEAKPLLHTWSLAVEEQFYIVLPLLLIALTRVPGGWRIPVLIATAAMSLIAAIVLVRSDPTWTFYWLPTRAWELLAGSLIATGALPTIRSAPAREAAAAVGLLLIAVAATQYDAHTRFPGESALLPVLGAALIIHAGSGGPTFTGKLLSWRPMVLIGLISYSLYLWHWPWFVLLEHQLARPLSTVEGVAAVVVAFALAWFSWRFIEQPFRRRGPREERLLKVFTPAVAVSVVFLTGGAALHLMDGVPNRFSSTTLAYANPARIDNDRCEISVDGLRRGELCALGSTAKKRFVLWGDSHASVAAAGLRSHVEARGLSGGYATKGACPPAAGVLRVDVSHASDCHLRNAAFLDLVLADPDIRTVVLAARWALYAEGERYGYEHGTNAKLVDASTGHDENAAVLRSGLTRLVEALTEAERSVILVAQVPEVAISPPDALARAHMIGLAAPVGPTRDEVTRRQMRSNEILRQLARDPHVTLVSPIDLLCPVAADNCLIEAGGQPLYTDHNHLSQAGLEQTQVLFSRMATLLDPDKP